MGDEAAWTHGLVADAELFQRMGATAIEIGHLDDTPLAEDARWYATAMWRGTKVSADDHAGPGEASRALALQLLEGAQCVHCGKPVTASPAGADEGVCTAGVCRWYVDDEHWLRGCDNAFGPPAGGMSRAQRRRQARVKRLR